MNAIPGTLYLGRMMKYGVCRGAEPLCKGSEGFPQFSLYRPFLARKGARGMVDGVSEDPDRPYFSRSVAR